MLSRKWDLINMSGNNPPNCGMFVISLHFKDVHIHIRKLQLDCLAAILVMMTRMHYCVCMAYITRFWKHLFCNTPLAWWVLSYLNRSLLGQGDLWWSGLQSPTKKLTWDNFWRTVGWVFSQDIRKAINANTVSVVGKDKVSQGWRRTVMLPVKFMMQSHRGVVHWWKCE